MERKTVLITGSTKGIGLGMALRLAQEGYALVLNYAADDEAAQQALQQCRQITSEVLLVKADVSKHDQVHALMQQAVEQFGSLDVLINNAAQVIDKPALEMSEEDWDQVIGVNLKGTFLCSQAAAKYMIQQKETGIIINIGASTGIRARKNGANTCASKAGIMSLTQSFALELGPQVRVVTVVPGLTLTEETKRRFHLDDPVIREQREASIPLGRVGVPDDIAKVITFLLSDLASFIHGQKIFVDGGQYMW
jgi:3-oxoacyl-[acyl-carrier protein] reductase